MTIRSAAAKKFPKGNDVNEECTKCGHPFGAHAGQKCPDLPPAKKQVTVDEAVIAKGGKPSTDFERELAAATGATAANELAAKAAENFNREVDAGVTEIIEVKHIRPSPRNPRTSLGDLTELVASLKSLKVMLQPILVREVDGGKAYEIVSGHRRFSAAKECGWESVPCLVHELTDVQALEVNLAEQLQRKELTPLEEGEACRELMELSGYTAEQVATRLGQSASWVHKRVKLCSLAPEVKKQLAKGDLSLTLAQAIAVLPTQKMQVEAAARVEEDKDYMQADELLEQIRDEYCKPLKGAGWKLTDADLVPEAGACSLCPKNSANNKTPGLFDNVKAPPTCSDKPCFESKAKAVWEKATAKYKAQGAKIIPLAEGAKLFLYGNALTYDSRYVEGKATVQEDGGKRSWSTLIEKLKPEERPQLHVAADKDGGIHELYVKDKATEAIAEHLELKWAKKAIAREEKQDDAREEQKEEQQLRGIREEVARQVKNGIAARIAKTGLTLPDARALFEEWDYQLERYLEAIGIDRSKHKGWKEKATLNELLAFFWWARARIEVWDGFDDEFKALAKSAGFDLTAMVKAQLATAKAEAEKAAAEKKAKGGKS